MEVHDEKQTLLFFLSIFCFAGVQRVDILTAISASGKQLKKNSHSFFGSADGHVKWSEVADTVDFEKEKKKDNVHVQKHVP